ncbi:hypothetical protein BV898_01114, partial [Hypsibius exemplaris]
MELINLESWQAADKEMRPRNTRDPPAAFSSDRVGTMHSGNYSFRTCDKLSPAMDLGLRHSMCTWKTIIGSPSGVSGASSRYPLWNLRRFLLIVGIIFGDQP